jgi:hypothetical protein
MVTFLVGLLERGLETQENPAATKAQIVKALKAMQSSLQFGEKVLSFDVSFFDANHLLHSGDCHLG